MQYVRLRSLRLDRLHVSFHHAILTVVEENGIVVRWVIDIEEAKHHLFDQINDRFRFWMEAVDEKGQTFKGSCMIDFVSKKMQVVKLAGVAPLERPSPSFPET